MNHRSITTYCNTHFSSSSSTSSTLFQFLQMDFSMITPRTCVLKVNFHCPACEKKVYKALQKINGVRTIEIDGRNGKVTVSGSADPYTLQKALSKIGKRAEILWDSSKASVNQHTANQNRSISVSQTQEIDPRQLEQLSKIKRLKQVELTKTIKFTFNDDDDSSQDLDTCASQFYADDHFNGRQVVPAHHRLVGGSSGGTAHGCCCHNNHNNHSNRAMNNNNYYHHGGNGGCGSSTRALPPADGCDHWRSGYAPSAPPGLPPLRRMPPPPQQYSHYGPNYFSDENPNGCRLI